MDRLWSLKTVLRIVGNQPPMPCLRKKQGVILCINLKNSITGFLIRELRYRGN